jgi:hypothetical protein
MKNQNSKIYHFVLVMTLFIFVSKKGRRGIFYVFDRGKFHMAAGRGYDWKKEKLGYSLWYRSTRKMESIF